MRLLSCIGIILLGLVARAQEGIANHGAMQLHGEGVAGFHADFRNDGPFDSP